MEGAPVSTRIPPKPALPRMPKSYRLPAAPGRQDRSGWDRITEALTGARNYWVCTARPDGRPHAMPVWGLWLGEVFYFVTDRESRKGRNLRVNSWTNVHLESGDDVVILEGRAEELTDPLALDLVPAREVQIGGEHFHNYHGSEIVTGADALLLSLLS